MTPKNQKGLEKPLTPTEILAGAMEIIEQALMNIFHGTVTIIVQDSRVIQIEKNEKIRLPFILRNRDSGVPNGNMPASKELSAMKSKIIEAVSSLDYGQMVIVIKDGKVVQLERTDKLRIPKFEGMYGEGI